VEKLCIDWNLELKRSYKMFVLDVEFCGSDWVPKRSWNLLQIPSSCLQFLWRIEEDRKIARKIRREFQFLIRWALKNGPLCSFYCFLKLQFHFPFNTKKTTSLSRYLIPFYVTVYYCDTTENKLKNSCRESLQIYLLNKPNLYKKRTYSYNFKALNTFSFIITRY
jgi:hypothetical protein